jgi:hypothetical protein
MLLTTFVELRVVAGRSRTRAGRPSSVSGRPMVTHTCHAAPMPRCAVALRIRFQNGMVVAWHVNQTRPRFVNQMEKTQSKLLAARHGRGTAWALWEWHGNDPPHHGFRPNMHAHTQICSSGTRAACQYRTMLVMSSTHYVSCMVFEEIMIRTEHHLYSTISSLCKTQWLSSWATFQHSVLPSEFVGLHAHKCHGCQTWFLAWAEGV